MPTEVIVASITALSTILVAIVGLTRKDKDQLSTLQELVSIRESLLASPDHADDRPQGEKGSPSDVAQNTPARNSLKFLDSSIEVTAARVEHDSIRTALYRRSVGAILATIILVPLGITLITVAAALISSGASNSASIAEFLPGLWMAVLGVPIFTLGLFSWDSSVKRKALACIPPGRDFPRNFIGSSHLKV